MSPPKGWSVTIPNAGPEIRNTNFAAFIAEVIKRLESNGMDHSGWKEQILHLMCQQRPDIECEDKDAPPQRAMTSDDVFRFLKTIWTSVEEGAIAVSEELQNQRVETCLACPRLGFISCFGGCSTIVEAVAKLTLGRSIRRHPDVHKKSCLECGCLSEIKTMWPLDILRKIDERSGTQPNYPPNCWVVTEAQNIPPNDSPSSPQPADPEKGT